MVTCSYPQVTSMSGVQSFPFLRENTVVYLNDFLAMVSMVSGAQSLNRVAESNNNYRNVRLLGDKKNLNEE